MPLTPEDVSNKRFTPVRLREGYDMSEVDRFLDEVEAELVRLTRENDDFRSKLSTGQHGGSTPPATPTAASSATPASTKHAAEDSVRATPAATPSVSAAPAHPKPTTVGEASSAAARLLENAIRNADELVDEAKTEADTILSEARTHAERLQSEAKTKADRLESDARTRSQMLDSETSERRQQLFGDLESEKNRVSTEVENLRSFEREYRSRLKSYFQQQLESLDGSPETAESNGQPPSRLRSLLGEESEPTS